MAKESLADIMRKAVREGTAKIHTCCPAKVISYDAATQTVTARVVLQSRYKLASKEIGNVKGPTLTNVPVLFPHSAAGYGLTFPLAEGDWVTLHIAERSLVEWKATARDDIKAADLRRFNFSDSFAYPGGQPPVAPVGASGVDAGAMVVEGADIRLGSSAASDKVALGRLVEERFTEIKDAIDNATIIPNDGGFSLQQTILLILGGSFPDSVGATKVSAE